MGFKVDSSFLRFLTMGAVGVRACTEHMRNLGFSPIELERGGSTNKIWQTKVKRLRVPDLLCAKTGVRVEVRAKSALSLKMSDAPTNPDRTWDADLRDEDLVAIVPVQVRDGVVESRHDPTYFDIEAMRASVGNTRLGPPKSVSEGAERDREWPSTVPKRDGTVLGIPDGKIQVIFDAGNKYTYQLKGKTCYVTDGDTFVGGGSIVASVVPRLADLTQALARRWDPLAMLASGVVIDRHAAAKVIPFTRIPRGKALAALSAAGAAESDPRVALECDASAAKLGSETATDSLRGSVFNPDLGALRMEAVFILGEVASTRAAEHLLDIAKTDTLDNSELRQAAIWELGSSRLRRYADLIPFIADSDTDVALHAVAAFGADASSDVVADLMTVLLSGTPRERGAASEALRFVGSDLVSDALATVARQSWDPWAVYTLGRFSPQVVRDALAGDARLANMEPLLLQSAEENWLSDQDRRSELQFLAGQIID